MTRLNLAYETLSDPDRRSAYDRRRNAQVQEGTEAQDNNRARQVSDTGPSPPPPPRTPSAVTFSGWGEIYVPRTIALIVGVAVVIAIVIVAVSNWGGDGNGDGGGSGSVSLLPTKTPVPSSTSAIVRQAGAVPVAAISDRVPTRAPIRTSTPVPTPRSTATPVPTPTPTPIPVLGQDYFTRGSSQELVLRVQGTPEGIDRYEALKIEVWSYGYSQITFSLPDGTVTEWANRDGNLKVRLLPQTEESRDPTPIPKPTPTSTAVSGLTPTPTPIPTPTMVPTPTPISVLAQDYFTRGSSQDDVLHVQGTPTKIELRESLGYETWCYGEYCAGSSVRFSLPEGLVTLWDNSDGRLKVLLLPTTSSPTTDGYFTRGSTQDDVLHVQGTPTKIELRESLGYETWCYGEYCAGSSVRFSLPEGLVTEWDNSAGNLNVR